MSSLLAFVLMLDICSLLIPIFVTVKSTILVDISKNVSQNMSLMIPHKCVIIIQLMCEMP